MKSSLDYVCVYTDFTSGRKALMIRKKFGLLGHAMLSEVIAWIGALEGWYADWTEETADLFATTRMFDLSISDQVRDVLLYMVEIGFFSPAAFKEHRVLTSPILYKLWVKAKEGAARKAKISVQKYLDQCVPEGSKLWKIRETLIAENPDFFAQTPEKNAQTPEKTPQTPEKNAQNAGFSAQSKVKESKGKESFEKERKKEEGGKSGSETIVQSRADPRWPEIRARVAGEIYEHGLSVDLTDAITAAAVRNWITVPQLHSWLRKARDELEVNRRTDQQRGKKERWKTLRPWIEEVYRVHGLTLPKCDGRKKEPPPIRPEDDTPEALEKARFDAGRAIMPR